MFFIIRVKINIPYKSNNRAMAHWKWGADDEGFVWIFNVLCILRCFSGLLGYKEWLFELRGLPGSSNHSSDLFGQQGRTGAHQMFSNLQSFSKSQTNIHAIVKTIKLSFWFSCLLNLSAWFPTRVPFVWAYPYKCQKWPVHQHENKN